jgi:hypothetical protein
MPIGAVMAKKVKTTATLSTTLVADPTLAPKL